MAKDDSNREDKNRAMLRQAKQAPQKRKRHGKLFVPMLILGSLALIVLLKNTFIFLIIGMMPSIVAYYMDKSGWRGTFKTVMACNLSGVLPFVLYIMHQESPNTAMRMQLESFHTWLIMYLSAFFGWFLIYMSPFVARFIINSFHFSQIARIEGVQRRLVEEWGAEIQQVNEEA